MQIRDVHRRDEVVGRLFEELVGFGRTIKARGADWGDVDPELGRTEVLALGVLASRGALRPGHLAAALGVDPSVVSRQLATLDRLGLITRAVDPTDRRAELVTLTDAGQERLLRARGAMCDVLADRLDDWDLDDLDRLVTLMGRLTRRLQTPLNQTNLNQTNLNQKKDAHV